MGKIYCIVHMDVAEGRAEDFRAAAKVCAAAAASDLAGTVAYEWFLDDNGRDATVIEIYDDPAAIALHSRVVGPHVMAVKEMATFSLDFAGDVPEAIADGMRKRLGAVTMFGPRFQGIVDAPASGKANENSGGMIFASSRFRIPAGKLEAFKALAADAYKRTIENDPGTVTYEWFFNADNSEALTLDTYRDVEAMKAHTMNAGPAMQQLMKLAPAETMIYGALPEKMRERFAPELGVRFGGAQIAGVM